ncbi:hypothetical protein DSO57_1015605 [Entomophthora muscae]|uniref:Uncharacterized protein n=1 Tax=Entomophthora muscae TaxID=34485 RepID=A0ACC2SI40_9FUNG|nr:hypothetical protein DSO57_1015605 [Entomophthora muscae]
MFKSFQELPLSCIIDSRPGYGGAIKDSSVTECSRESSLLGKGMNAIDINSVPNSPIKRKPTKCDLAKRKRPLLSLKKDTPEETIHIGKDIILPVKRNLAPLHSVIVTISRAEFTSNKNFGVFSGINHFLLKAVINPSKVKEDVLLNSNIKGASNWELCIDTFPVLPEDGCFVNMTEYPVKKKGSLVQRELSKLSSSLITIERLN